MTLEDEKKLVLLTSIIEVGGSGTKKRVLDNIERKKYYELTAEDERTMENRNEEAWRNDLAFIRMRLVNQGAIDKSMRDNWQITDTGRFLFASLAKQATTKRHFHKITAALVEKASSLLLNDKT